MKKLLIAMGIGLLLSPVFTSAQISVNVNLATQPAWAPIGYDYARYYYLPDIETYYDVNRRVYVYPDGRKWVTARSLPARYNTYNVYDRYKVVINDGRNPWTNHKVYRTKYVSYKGRPSQVIIRDAPDKKYWKNPGNRNYGQWKKSHTVKGHHDNGHHYEGDHARRQNYKGYKGRGHYKKGKHKNKGKKHD